MWPRRLSALNPPLPVPSVYVTYVFHTKVYGRMTATTYGPIHWRQTTLAWLRFMTMPIVPETMILK